ncbi:hypothetical protein ACH4C6_03560 [Streptomyces sp. NPDC017943]|uniref:hypothetical protein n=1 Tax=Streptomyces sp. NPDC017943 TaxID=3365019 RepID=UPI0037B391BD
MHTMRHEGKAPDTYVGTLDWLVPSLILMFVVALDYVFGARSWASFVAWPVWAWSVGLLIHHWCVVLRRRDVELWGWWAAALAHVTAAWHIIAVVKDVK